MSNFNTNNPKSVPGNPWIRRMWFAFFTFWVTIILFFAGVAYGLFGELPGFADLENPKNLLATEVIGSDGVVLGKYFVQNRSFTPYSELSPHLIQALVATEDVRFERHSGIDVRSLLRAIVYLGSKGGASTITQQLALNLFSGERARSKPARILQKCKEWVISVQLERRYTKQEILAMYLNTVDFGYNSFGIKSAARTYFNKDARDLNIQESAVLVGLLKGITLYSPVRNPERSLNRRNTVLSQMAKYGYLKDEQADSLQELPLKLNLRPSDHAAGTATYFREYLRGWLNQWVKDNPRPDGKKWDIYRDGLRVYTTLDSRMQTHAEEAVATHMKALQNTFFGHWKGKGEPWGDNTEILDLAMKRCDRYRDWKEEGLSESQIRRKMHEPLKTRLFSWEGWRDTTISPMDSIRYAKKFLHTGFMAMEPESGHIKAWVGGIDMQFTQYDHVNKNARRQAGSSFKPFVYTLAVDNGFDPCMRIPNQPVTFEEFENWTPDNYDDSYGGTLNMFEGLAKSINSIVAYLMKQIGPDAVIELSRNMGIESPMEPYPSLCLGAFDMSVYEMVGAYATFANKGVWTKPIFVTRIVDKDGNELARFDAESREVFSEETAYVMTKMLEGVVNRGTAARLRGKYALRMPLGGKTGTTQNNSDGWFIGITPGLALGAWVGADDRAVHFRSTSLGGGANSALPIVGEFLTRVWADPKINMPERYFEAPESLTIPTSCN